MCVWENMNFKWGSKWLLFINSAFHCWRKTLCVGGEIMNKNGLCVFKDQSEIHNISLKWIYLYLQLRSAMQANGIPLNEKFDPKTQNNVRNMYHLMQECTQTPISAFRIWNRDFSHVTSFKNLDRLLKNIPFSSPNSNNWRIRKEVYFPVVHYSDLMCPFGDMMWAFLVVKNF